MSFVQVRIFQYSSYLFPKVFSCHIWWNLNEWFSRNSCVSEKACSCVQSQSFDLLHMRYIQLGSFDNKGKSENCQVLCVITFSNISFNKSNKRLEYQHTGLNYKEK